jgi:hypothetical protein
MLPFNFITKTELETATRSVSAVVSESVSVLALA